MVNANNELVCYLAGTMRGDCQEQCMGWRKQVRDYYANWKDTGRKYPISFLDPYNGIDEKLSNDGIKSDVPKNLIVHADCACIRNSDLVVANMNTFKKGRAPIGTISEVALAWEYKKAVVMITDDPVYINHPFMAYFTSWQVNTVEEMLEQKVLNQFYKRWHSAQY